MSRVVDPLLTELSIAGATAGPLTGVTVAVKDIIDVAGQPTGAGNPDWLAEATPAAAHATALLRLLDAGATVVGKAITDELAFSLSGSNLHYGTPRNPAAPGRVPGGSSSGSASAVALGLADLGLGTDTAGSIRVPAAYCGLFGLRPTHGRVPMRGIRPLAPTFDTCGLLAADGDLLARGARALLGAPADAPVDPPAAVVLATDMLALADPPVAAAVRAGASDLAAALGRPLLEASVFGGRPAHWREVLGELQRIEAWRCNGAWITSRRPRLAPDIAARLAAGEAAVAEGPQRIDQAVAAVQLARGEVCAAIAACGIGSVLALPATPTVAPELDPAPETVEHQRARAFALTCPAGLAGAPQLTVPLRTGDGPPAGLGLLVGPGEDERLLALATELAAR